MESLLERKAVTLWNEVTEHNAVSLKTSFQFLTEDTSFSSEPTMGFQISLWKFHKNSHIERLLEGKAVTLWDELTEHKALSQKASFQFLTDDISFFTIALWGLPNITLPIPQEQTWPKASWRERCNSVRWINRTQSIFSESFFPVFNGRYFLFHHSLLRASKYHFANSKRTALAKGFLKGKM